MNDYRPAHLRVDHNITRASRRANARHNKPANRRARRNAARILAIQP